MRRLASVLCAGLLAASQGVRADGEAEADYRHYVMEAVGGHMQAMATILKKQVHLEDFPSHARAMAGLAGVAPGVFPEGSLTDKSKALAAIWENPEDFRQAMERFVAAAKELDAAAQTGEMGQMGPALGALGDACKGCHDSYKAD